MGFMEPRNWKWSVRQDFDRVTALKATGGRAERSRLCHPGVTPDFEKWSGRLDSNQRPPAPKAKEPTQLGAAGDRCPSFLLGNFQLGATAGNRELLPIVSRLSSKG